MKIAVCVNYTYVQELIAYLTENVVHVHYKVQSTSIKTRL